MGCYFFLIFFLLSNGNYASILPNFTSIFTLIGKYLFFPVTILLIGKYEVLRHPLIKLKLAVSIKKKEKVNEYANYKFRGLYS